MKIWIIFLCTAVFSSKKITSKDYRALIDKPLVAQKSLIEKNKKFFVAFGLDIVLKALIYLITLTEYSAKIFVGLIGLDFLLNAFLFVAVFIRFIQLLWGPNRQLRQFMFLLSLPIVSLSLVAYLGSSLFPQGTIMRGCIGSVAMRTATGMELINQQKYVFVLGTYCSTAASLKANISEVMSKICSRAPASNSGTKTFLEALKKPLKSEWAIDHRECTEGEFLAAKEENERMIPLLQKKGINYRCDDGKLPPLETGCCSKWWCPEGCSQYEYGSAKITYKDGKGKVKKTFPCICRNCKNKLYEKSDKPKHFQQKLFFSQ